MTSESTSTPMSQLAPSTRCTDASSPRLDDTYSDMFELESSYDLRLDNRYTLPPIRIDASPISFELPLAQIEQEHKLYEAKAPAPLALPRSVAFAHFPEDEEIEQDMELGVEEYDDYDGIPESETTSSVLSPSPSLIPLPPSQSPSPESPLPSPTLPPPLPALSPVRLVAQRQNFPITRRYLAPAYVRGECLPFAIAEEQEPEVSESEYSTESAIVLNSVNHSSESASDSTATESTSASGTGSATQDDTVQPQPVAVEYLDTTWYHDTVKKRSVKSIALGKRMKGLMLIGQKVGFRGRLGS